MPKLEKIGSYAFEYSAFKEVFSPANVKLTLNVNKESEVTNGNEWFGTTWKEIKFVEGN